MFITYLKTPTQIRNIENANKIAAEFLALAYEYIRVGICTFELEELAIKFCERRNVCSAFYQFNGFPNHLCVSINDEIIHGLPSSKIIKDGDIVSVDFGIVKDGYFSDTAFTKIVGNVDTNSKKLVETTKVCLFNAYKLLKPGNRLQIVSKTIEKTAQINNFNVIKNFGGHGVGLKLHEYPPVSNYTSAFDVNLPLRNGMVLAIEPMLVEGSNEYIRSSNGWTVLTSDGLKSAHFESSIAILNDAPLILGTSIY